MAAAGRLTSQFLVPSGWQAGTMVWGDDGVIASLEGSPLEAPDLDRPRIVAGFVDLHVHGGGGFDAMSGEAAVRGMARYHATQGTVALAPTTMTAAPDLVAAGLAGIEAVRAAPEAGEALVLGAHLEGPFINACRLGAQPDCVLPYDRALVERFCAAAQLAVATIAPEIEGGLELTRQLSETGCRVQVGHSDATAEQAAAAASAGASGYTHLYNAMSPFSNRKAGVVSQALAHGEHAELICDLEHVDEHALLTAVRAIPQAYAITDSTSAAGQSDGEYRLGGAAVVKSGATVRTPAGVLAGTAMTLWQARCKLLELGLPETLVQQMVAGRPAAYLGRSDLGELEPGRLASMVQIDGADIGQVWLAGRPQR